MTSKTDPPREEAATESKGAAEAHDSEAPAPPPPPAGPLEWLWRGQALEAARRAGAEALSPRQRTHQLWAASALAEAERLLSGVAPGDDRKARLALDLFRQSAYWSLLVLCPEARGLPPREAFARAPAARLAAALGDDAEASVKLLRQGFADDDEKSQSDAVHEARAARKAARALLAQRQDAPTPVGEVLLQRWGRSAVFAALTAALLSVGALRLHIARQGADVALGKPWRISAPYSGYPASGTVQPNPRGGVLFHTTDAANNWVEVDLGAPKSVHMVEVVNRQDCCQERAFPLVVELSTDQKTWVEVDKKTEPFSRWTADFSSQQARWVRLRNTSKNFFHLQTFSVH